MSARSQQSDVAYPDELVAERFRIVERLMDRVPDMAESGVAAIVTQIPAYADRDEAFLADVRDQLAHLCHTGLSALLEHRKVTAADIAYARRAAARRARAGLTLVDYISAFRLGQQALWKLLLSTSDDSELGREAALSLVVPLTRFCDLASTQAANAYLEFQQYLSAETDESRALLDSLLDGALPERGPQLSLAHAHGIGADPAMPLVVVTAVVLDSTASGPGQRGGSDSDARHFASAALARVGVNGLRTLAVARRSEVIAILPLGRSGDTATLCERLRRMQEKLRATGIPLAVGISPVVTRIADLPRAYQESRAALDLLPTGGGVLALPELTPFRYLLLRADETARHLIDPRIEALLAEDRTRGGALADTIRAFADADLNLREAADALCVHHNTAKYRLGRIQELTGRNPRRVKDLVELLVAIDLQDPQADSPAESQRRAG
ncbi:helix-turn-helix domain-containing protein [Nocardia huaxiensis]|uniref:Helix-turn-helix domain-containing protein n=1 Tax=Nocardia huaxiensis TaxID=2755382 RepID=A0A7D6VCE6_9NOCA|nr:helix-turn-helix domain-containing protein [Nocardia huaxiensis]QLY31751.1 helix-turn-helix domain-containing protein [Nocardia huaxiensis]